MSDGANNGAALVAIQNNYGGQGSPPIQHNYGGQGNPPTANVDDNSLMGLPTPALPSQTPDVPTPGMPTTGQAMRNLIAQQEESERVQRINQLREQEAEIQERIRLAQLHLNEQTRLALDQSHAAQAARVVAADLAKRQVHAPGTNVEPLLDLSQTQSYETQIGLFLAWVTSIIDLLQGKVYSTEIETWIKSQISTSDQHTVNVMASFFASAMAPSNGPQAARPVQRFVSAIDFLQQFFSCCFTSFDVPTEISVFLRHLKVSYGSSSRNYATAPSCSVLAQRTLRVLQFRDNLIDLSSIPADTVTMVMVALPVSVRQRIYEDQIRNQTRYDTYEALHIRLRLADDEYARDHRDTIKKRPQPTPSQPATDRDSANTTGPGKRGGGRGRGGRNGGRHSQPDRDSYYQQPPWYNRGFYQDRGPRPLADPSKFRANSDGTIKKCNKCQKLGHAAHECRSGLDTKRVTYNTRNNDQRKADEHKNPPAIKHALNSAQTLTPEQQQVFDQAKSVMIASGYQFTA